MFSPHYAWFGVLIGVPISLFTMRAGRLGWAVALIAGAAVGAVIGVLLGSAVVFVFFGTLEPSLSWLILRRLAPDTLAAHRRG